MLLSLILARERKMKLTFLHGAIIAALSASYQVHAYPCDTLPYWDKVETYTSGDKVQIQDNAYEAAHWTKGKNPVEHSEQWGEWKNLGQCDDIGGNLPPSVSFSSPTNKSFCIISQTCRFFYSFLPNISKGRFMKEKNPEKIWSFTKLGGQRG